MPTHLRNSDWNPAVSKTVYKTRWSTLSKALDWSKLISAASLPSFIPSTTSRIKCRLLWIDQTANVCSEPIRSLMTTCKRFAETLAKIFNSVLSRVMGLWSSNPSQTCLSPFFSNVITPLVTLPGMAPWANQWLNISVRMGTNMCSSLKYIS